MFFHHCSILIVNFTFSETRLKSALQINIDDLFADIGCGTGTFARMFVQDLNQPIDCIDPNNIIDALSSESASFGIQKFKMTGEEYLSYHSPTKLLIKEVTFSHV